MGTETKVTKSVLEQFNLDGQTALIVGGNRGLGLQIARALPYATSKGAVLQLARELAKDNITVNALLPGPFATELNLPLTNDPEKYEEFISNIPMSRWGELHEIGGLALYLASPASSYVTGAGFSIDGGWTLT